MLANPTIAAAVVRIDHDILGVGAIVRWRTLGIIVFIEDIAAHDLGIAVRPGEHESVGHLVLSRPEEAEDLAAGSMASLVVVVVDKEDGIPFRQHSPFLAEVPQVACLLARAFGEDIRNVHAVFELCDTTQISVFSALDRFTSHVDNFHKHKRTLVWTKDT